MGKISNKIINSIILITLFSFLVSLNYFDEQLLHTVPEIFILIVVFSIFSIAWTARSYLNNNFLIFLGIASPFIGIIILLHILTSQSLVILPYFTHEDSLLFWIVGRFMLALTFLAAIALLYKKNRLKPQYVISFCFVFLTFILLLIILKPFSSAFEIEDRLFLFKIFETVILLSLIIALLLLIRIRKKFDIQVYRYIVWSILFFILSDLLFHMELSENISEWLNIFRHYFNILAYYLIFKAIVDTGIKKPFDLIFRELKAKEEQLKNQAVTDELTGVLNRRAAFDILEKLLNLAKRNEQYVSICFIDIDDLKLVNDSFGHSAGDELLSTFAATIVKTMRNSDFFCRLGGDEFLLILPDCCLEEAECLLVRIKENIKQVNNQGSKAYNIEFSYGLAFYDYHNEINVDRLIEMADNNMYKNKEDRKHEAIQLTINDLFKPISKSAAQTE